MADRVKEFAQHRSLVDDMVHEVVADCWRGTALFYDVRRAPAKDTSGAIEHQENGNAAQTQRTVMSQEGFEQVCKDIVNAVWNVQKQQILALAMCQHGFHKFDASARQCIAMQNYLSRAMLNHLSRNTIFNSGEQYGKRGHIAMLENVRKWLQPGKARELTDGGEPPYSQLYARRAVRVDFEACATRKTLWGRAHAKCHMARQIG
ncbi:unnamed protein product, partial [Prorocentrum cordatum]